MKRLMIIATVALALSACSPKLDGSSDEAFKASAEKVAKSLPEEKRGQFAGAMMAIGMSNIDFADVMSGKATPDSMSAKMRESLNGLTADDVIERAKGIGAERDAKERQQALAEIKELQDKKVASDQAKRQLASFQVLRSRYVVTDGIIGPEPSFEMTVRNGTNRPVSRAHFLAVLASPGRAVPWKSEPFNYEIPGGIEPGEQKEWKLEPGYEYRNLEVPADAILTITATRLDGPDDKPFLDAEQFDEDDAKRLSELKAKFQ